MSTQIAILQNEIEKIEDGLLNQVTVIQDMNQFLSFYFVYLSHYLPLLEFTVENLPENNIAKLANFGMLIDHLSSKQISRLIIAQNDLLAKEISLKTGKNKNEVTKYLSSLSISQKLQISSTLIVSASLIRDRGLAVANSKFSGINKIIVWSNILSHIVRFPALADMIVDEEFIENATVDLNNAKKIISDKNRTYDYILAQEWSDALGLSYQKIQEIPKYFVGAKLSWLEAMSALEFAKCLYFKDPKFGEKALSYNSKIISALKNQNISLNEWSYRNFNSGGPNMDIRNIIETTGEKNIRLRNVDSHTIYVEGDGRDLFIILPSNFSFYTNSKMVVNLSQNGIKFSIPLREDFGAIINFYKSVSKFVINNVKALSKPEESDYLQYIEMNQGKIKKIIEDVDSIKSKLLVTFNENVNPKILETVNVVTKNATNAVMLYGIIFSLEKIAESTGLTGNVELWSETRLAITAILSNGLTKLTDKAKALDDHEEDIFKTRMEESNKLTAEDKISILNERMEQSENYFRDTINDLGNAGLNDLMKIMKDIREILLSGLSLEEINQELKKYSNVV